jgi:hypothetical protein
MIGVLCWESYETHKYKMQRFWLLNHVVNIVTARLLTVKGSNWNRYEDVNNTEHMAQWR